MNIILELDQFNINYVHYQEPVKNTLMDNSNFIRAIYSNNTFMLNGIYLRFNLNINSVEKSFNKYKCMFNKNSHAKEISALCSIEKEMLEKLNIPNKVPLFRIREQLVNGYIKLFTDNGTRKQNNEFIIKISGIWENNNEYGITYKIVGE